MPGPVNEGTNKAYEEHFCPLQIAINSAYFEKQMENNKLSKNIKSVQTYKFPYPKYIKKGNTDSSVFFTRFCGRQLLSLDMLLCAH